MKSQIHSSFRILRPFISLVIQGDDTYHHGHMNLEFNSIAMSQSIFTIQYLVYALDFLELEVWKLQIDYHSLSAQVN
jgi:hypothetical protein